MATSAMTDVNIVIENDDFIVPTSRASGPMHVAEFPSAKSFSDNVLNPFRIRHSPTYKIAVVDEEITPTSAAGWGGMFDLSLSLNADVVLGAYLAIDLPPIEAEAGERCRWVDYPGVNIIESAQFKSSSWDFETLTWVSNAVHRYFFIPKQNQDVYKEIVGQQNRREIYVADTLSPQLLALSNAIAIDPRVTDSGILNTSETGVAYIGYEENGVPATASSPAYALVGVPQSGTENHTVKIASAQDPTPADHPLVNTGSPAVIDRTGSVIDGYNGLQTWKTRHEATRVYHMFHFWWCRTPQTALILAAIATNLQTLIRVQVRQLKQMYMTTGGAQLTTSTANGAKLSIQPRLTTAYVAEAVRIVFSHYEEQFIGNVYQTENQTINTIQSSKTLNPSEMIPELFVALQDQRHAQANEWDRFNAYNDGSLADLDLSPIKTLGVKVNNGEREKEKRWEYWAYLRPFRTHENITVRKYIFACPFTLFSDSYQPTSYINFKTNMPLQLPIVLSDQYATGTYSINMYIVYKQIRFFKYTKHTLSTTFS